jgi:hypothetical protein
MSAFLGQNPGVSKALLQGKLTSKLASRSNFCVGIATMKELQDN